jgi:hypothetical protein
MPFGSFNVLKREENDMQTNYSPLQDFSPISLSLAFYQASIEISFDSQPNGE